MEELEFEKENAIKIASQLFYNNAVINKIAAAIDEHEISRVLHDARFQSIDREMGL